MAGITDSAFRQICKSFGADIVYSEMISVAAIVYNSKKTLELMRFDEKERPFIVQLFGSKPEHFAHAAKFITKKILARQTGGKPDGLDINFGCPVKKVAKQGAGAILMNDLKLARQIVAAVLANTNLPISVKCRSRVGKTTVLDFLKTIKDLPVAAIMIHGRSLAQGHSGEVDWQIIKQARKYFSGVILANGGVKDKKSAAELLRLTQADGVSIGQGALGRPWIFEEVKLKSFENSLFVISSGAKRSEKSLILSKYSSKGFLANARNDNFKIFEIALKHAKLAHKLKGRQGIIEMRKHLCWYVSGQENASELRRELVKVKSLEQTKKILKPLFLFK